MQLYIYAKSGHNFGLENVRRVSAIYNMLQDSDPILCTADYRAATFAKSELGIKKGVGIDVIGNLPNVMERGDMLIYDDSGEASETMQSHMKSFSTHLYKMGIDIPFDVVDNTFFEDAKTKIEKAIFFADDDYANWFYELSLGGKKQDLPLLLGHYFFLGNEDKLANYFSDIIEEEEYTDTIKNTKYLLTSSINSCMESLASGNNPIYFYRKDKDVENAENFSLLKKYNIPIIDEDNLDEIVKKFDDIILNYPKLNKIEKFDISSIKKEISDTLEKFKLIQPSLDYKF